MTEYISAMMKMQTSGMDITILMMCEMLNISVVMLVKDFMWKSHDVDVGDDKILYLLMFRGGRCVSARNKDGSKFELSLPQSVKQIIAQPIQVNSDSSFETSADIEVEETSSLNQSDYMQMPPDLLGGMLYCIRFFYK